jgi:hypothetical protein
MVKVAVCGEAPKVTLAFCLAMLEPLECEFSRFGRINYLRGELATLLARMKDENRDFGHTAVH